MKTLYLLLCLGLLSATAIQTHADEHYQILTKEQHSTHAKANLDDLSWLAGRWHWSAMFDLPTTGETVVSASVNGQMLGHARGMNKNGLMFNEILTYTQRGDGVDFRVKHFSYDLHGWEPIDQPIVHPLIKVDGNTYYFDKHTIVRRSQDLYTLYLAITNDEGQIKRYAIQHRRMK